MMPEKSEPAEKPWKKKRPAGTNKKKLTPGQKAKAKARAHKAGRRYPNLIDNMWASQIPPS